ncbi:MAG: HD domain-containing phosphohydrolase [Gemmatimonadota bacterium]
MSGTPSAERSPRVLLVDDEPNVLASLRRYLGRVFDVTAVSGPQEGLAAIEEADEGFAVIVSDLKMPVMDGITFLTHARERSPDTVRVLLTGHADLHSAIAAVNEGSIFRFLTKPCRGAVLEKAIWAAADQYDLITAQRTLLERTLHGSIKALTDVLALINPAGFGRATRAKNLVAEFTASLELDGRWEVEIAAMLSQIGSVTLSGETVEKLYRGQKLTYSEALAVEKLPRVATDLIRDIPRLEGVQTILAGQNLRFDGLQSPPRSPRGEAIPWGARVLKIVLDFDVCVTKGMSVVEAVDAMRGRSGWYDPQLLSDFAEMHAASAEQQEIVSIRLGAIRPGMIFAEDVQTRTGILLVARGQEASERLVERVRNLAHLDVVQDTVHVIVPAAAPQSTDTLTAA